MRTFAELAVLDDGRRMIAARLPAAPGRAAILR